MALRKAVCEALSFVTIIYILLCLIGDGSGTVQATHFRGGTISWKPSDSFSLTYKEVRIVFIELTCLGIVYTKRQSKNRSVSPLVYTTYIYIGRRTYSTMGKMADYQQCMCTAAISSSSFTLSLLLITRSKDVQANREQCRGYTFRSRSGVGYIIPSSDCRGIHVTSYKTLRLDPLLIG